MNFLSLGAGVQSSTILLMSCYGELEKLDAAVFSDTGWESKATYKWFEFLKGEARRYGIPVHTVQQGKIKDDALVSKIRGLKKDGVRWASMPLFTKKTWLEADRPQLLELIGQRQKDGKPTDKYRSILSALSESGEFVQNGMIRRQCTYEYKIRILEKKFRELAGYQPRKRIPAGTVEVWKGISLDEARRATISDRKWISFYYPLIEMRMTRRDCLNWFDRKGMPNPPRSACVGCPYHSNREWREIKINSPAEFKDAVDFDKAIRSCGGMRGDVFIHSKRIPLEEVDLRNDQDRGQLQLWSDECAGVCNV